MRILSLILVCFWFAASAGVHAAESKKKPKSKISTPSTAPGPSYAKRQDVAKWAEQISLENQLDVKWVKSQLAQARMVPSIPKLILPPAQVNKKTGLHIKHDLSSPSAFKRVLNFGKKLGYP